MDDPQGRLGGSGLDIGLDLYGTYGTSPVVPGESVNNLLLETGDNILLEDGGVILEES